MINVSFYLLTPKANSQSNVYVSIVSKKERIRFATGYKFITNYCNSRNGKGSKSLPKKDTEFYFDYTNILTSVRDKLIRIEMELERDKKNYNLEQIREIYLGKAKDKPEKTLIDAFDEYIVYAKANWTSGTYSNNIQFRKHLINYENEFGNVSLRKLNEDFWNSLRDEYFVNKRGVINATVNCSLRKLKQFLKFANKKSYLDIPINVDELKYLKEDIEPFKIALNETEVETLLNLDLSHDKSKEQVRDLFALEIFSGQRFSDIPNLFNKNNISDTGITIYQKKTKGKVSIPLHPRLKSHLKELLDKYPDKLPILDNKKFNDEIKEICKLAGLNKMHTWQTQSGKNIKTFEDFRFNLVSSHTGRRSFCTLATKENIPAELIMRISGHKSYVQFQTYIKVDDDDLNKGFENFLVKP